MGFRPPPRLGVCLTVAAPPCGDSASGGSGLDGALPTSVACITAVPGNGQPPRGCSAAALSTACEADVRPLTPPFASRIAPGRPGSLQDTRTAAHLFASTKEACSARSAFSRRVPEGSALRFAPDPPPCVRLCHRTADFRRVFTTGRSRAPSLGAEPWALRHSGLPRRAPLFEICNRHDPRARPTNRPNPLTEPAVARLPSSAKREPRDFLLADGGRASFRSWPAEVSPVRG